jgi:8-oxo-dGTP diphosphatase
MKLTQVVSAIIRHDDQILMIHQPDDEGLYWFIPGGVMEPGELITEALSREVKEETGLTLTDGGCLAFGMRSGGKSGLILRLVSG